MLFKLFGPNAYGRYVLRPILLGVIIFIPVFWMYSYAMFVETEMLERFSSGIIMGYLLGSFPSGYHMLNRFGDIIYNWTHGRKSSTDRIVNAIYNSKRRKTDLFDNITFIFNVFKVLIKFVLSLIIGPFCFPYVTYEFIREIHRTRLYYEARKKKTTKANRRTA